MDKLMIFVLLCCPLGFLKCNADDSEQERGYVFTIPYKLPMGGITTGCISLQNTEPPAYIVTELLHENEVISSASYNLTSGAKACLKLNVPMIHTPNAMVRLTIEFAKYPDYVVKDERNVGITQNSRLVLVDSDKGIYKPGDAINIRIIHYYQDFMPVMEPVSHMYISNPSNKTVMEWKKLRTKNGMRQLKFYLNTDAELGHWLIWIKMYPTLDIYFITHFEVRTEGPSKFKVTIIPPPYILADATKLTWKICVRYNYDVPARGTLVTKLSPYAANASKPYEEMVKKIELNSPDGCTEIVTSGAVLNLDRWSALPNEMVLIANFTERETGITQGEVSRTPILYEAIKLKFAPTMAKYFKLDAPYQGKLLVLRPDNSPVPDEIIQLCLETSGKDAFMRYFRECRNFTSSSEGSVDFIIPPQHKSATLLTISASAVHYSTKHYFEHEDWKNFMNQPETEIRLYPVYSASSSYVVVTGGKERPICGKNYMFDVMYTRSEYIQYGDSIVFHYSVNSKSGILLDEQKIHQANGDTELDYSQFDNLLGILKAVPTNFYLAPIVHKFQISIKITPNMAPMSELLVYYVRSDSEIVSASHMIEVGHCYNNDVRAEWNTADVQKPGAPVKFNIQAAPDSLCGVSFVEVMPPLRGLTYNLIESDKVFKVSKRNNPITMDSIMLESGCKDFSANAVIREFIEYQIGFSYSGPARYVNEMQAFNDFGVIVMTNMKQTTQSCLRSHRVKLSDTEAHSLDISYQKRVDEVPLHESHFPTTWLWEMESVTNTSSITSEYTIPDKRTDWISHIACMSPTRGLGVAPIRVLQSRRPVFFDYDLLPVAKVGEMIFAKARIFNYMDRKIPVTVNMKIDEFDDYRSTLDVSFCVQPRDTVNYQYLITPRNIGTFYVVADVSIDRNNTEICDGSNIPDLRINIRKPIKVLGEGFEVEQSTTALLCTLTDTADVMHTFDVSYPNDIIPNSAEATLSLVGNVLGVTPDNLKELVKIPTDSGEQNIAKFMANVFVITFMDTLKIKNVIIRRNVIKNLQQGYQTQLNYRLDDGSYSRFQGKESSIWYTISVIKAFALARNYTYISETDLQQSVDWILSQRSSYGCFLQIEPTVHKDTQGEIKYADALEQLTVYILISLLESKLKVPITAINDAMSCIQADMHYLRISLYTRIMTTYALTLLNHPTAEDTIIDMSRFARFEGDEMSWVDTRSESLSSSIEMTSYMVLAITQLGRHMHYASKAVRWLMKHQNSVGGFLSTHNTALALQAITAYAIARGIKTDNLSILTTGVKLDRIHELDDETDTVPVNIHLPQIPTSIAVSAEGHGCVVAQVNVKYRVVPRTSEFFDLSVTARSTVPGNCDILELKACSRYKASDYYTNMAIIEVEMLTGYVPVRDSLERLITLRKMQKYEIKNNELHLYFKSLGLNETCVSFKIKRQMVVKNIKPSNVRVVDIYRPDIHAVAMYTINPECSTVLNNTNTKIAMAVQIEDTSGSILIYGQQSK